MSNLTIPQLKQYLTSIKNNESELSQNASLDVWIECMEGDHAGIVEIDEYLQLKAEKSKRKARG